MSLMASTSRESQPRPFSLERLDALLALDGVTWRHDIDQSLTASLEMAEFEAQRGVRATFYVMARSPYYNPFSHHGIETINRIVQLGHRLGVHCDLNAQRAEIIGRDEIMNAAHHEHDLLARLYPVGHNLSFHCPPASVLWTNVLGFESAYAPQWQGHYFADSRGAFLYGDPEDSDVRPLQINLHAEWWWPDAAEADLARTFWR
jgi:hypothetical protein